MMRLLTSSRIMSVPERGGALRAPWPEGAEPAARTGDPPEPAPPLPLSRPRVTSGPGRGGAG